MSASTRNKITAIHAIKNKLGWDDVAYRAFIFQHSGEKSCMDLSDFSLDKVYREIKKKQPHQTVDPDKPTWKQKHVLRGLIESCGYAGDDDPRFVGLMKKTAKVSAAKDLDRRGMSNMISALLRIKDQRERAA
jgi:hypothetical protein